MAAVQITERDVVEASRAYASLGFRHPATIAIGVGLLVIATALTWPVEGAKFDPTPLVVTLLIILLFVVLYRWNMPRLARRQLRQHVGLQEPIHYEWTPDRFKARGRTGMTDMEWGDLWAWAPYAGGYLLFPSSRIYHLVPDRAFGLDAEESVLRNALAVHGVSRKPFRRTSSRTLAKAGPDA